MKLERIEIKNYRSLFHDYDARESFTLELGDGMNAIAGPNNVGKSNVFRALSLALDPDFEFDRSLDMPAIWNWSKPSVTLTFRVPERGRPSREATLIKLVNQYERKVNPGVKRTYAEMGEVKLRVTIEGAEDTAGTRREVFVVRGGGARSLNDDDPVARKAIESFHRCIHFVKIESGQSLDSLLEGNFRDILRNVLRDHLRTEFNAAEKARQRYCDDLQSGLLVKLSERINTEVRELFPEIADVSLTPEVPSLDDTLSRMQVQVADVAATDLSDKGTGVRGGLIVAMLRHFADVGKRSMLFAVEEPESFLHPGAQEQLREDLEALAERRDISLLVTTHSPFVVSRQEGARVFALDKDSEGRTVLKSQADGTEPHAGVLGGLYRDRLIMEWLDRSDALPSGAVMYLVVEGSTDRDYARLALESAGRDDLLEGIEFRLAGSQAGGAGGGASLAVMQALVTHAASPVPVAVLLDNDEPGRDAALTLRQIGSKTKLWREGKSLFSYRAAFKDAPKDFGYEAEDLWPDHLAAAFLKEHPDADRGRIPRPKPEGGWHYDIEASAKGAFVEFLHEHVEPADCDRWVSLMETIRAGIGAVPPGITTQLPPKGISAETASPSTPGPGPAASDSGAPARWERKRSYLTAIRDEIVGDLEAEGMDAMKPHAHGAYMRINFGPSHGDASNHHLSVRVTTKEALVALIINQHDTRSANIGVLAQLRDDRESEIEGLLPTFPSVWGGGEAGALRANAICKLPGGGYRDGDVEVTADWIGQTCLGWAELFGTPTPA